MNPVGWLNYNALPIICVPTSLHQEAGEGLRAKAGKTKLTKVVCDGGLTQVQRAKAGPLDVVCRLGPSRPRSAATPEWRSVVGSVSV